MKKPNKSNHSSKNKAGPARASAKAVEAGDGAQGRAIEVCPVVGFGASAGGLEAFTEILEHISPKSDFAIVFVQHLDPKHASILTELLARSTSLPVLQIEDGMALKPNYVYVIPPNADMVVRGNRLNLESRPQGHHLPIDTFFRSLARDRAGKAIGVILSGTGSDGTLGLKAIKAEGGITFAQDPTTAKYDGMPRSAIAAGCVDFILPPQQIAEELARLHQHPYLVQDLAATEQAPQEETQSFDQILHLLGANSGVDFGLYKPGTIRRRIMRRMALLKMDSAQAYAQVLKRDRGELEQLFQDVLINVTAFFREPTTFEAIRTRLLPVILKERNSHESLRVWVPGCATGEDAYSIAITLLEYMRETGTGVPIQIFGTDLSEAALERARVGVYPETIGADVTAERLRRFFVRVNSSYQITRSVRDTCIFARQNITKDPPFSKLDLILCRNVLIYLGPTLQANSMRLFHYALRPDGYLVLGLSENTGLGSELFWPIDNKLKIYSKKPAPFAVTMELGSYQESRQTALPRERAASVPEFNLHRRVDQILLAHYSPAAVVIDRNMQILEFRGRTAPFLEHPPGAANLNLLKLTSTALGLEIQKLVRKAEAKTLVRSKVVSLSTVRGIRRVMIRVSPIHPNPVTDPHFVVALEEQPADAKGSPAPKTQELGPKSSRTVQQIRDLERELAATREYLQGVIEEQEASAEELKSANEEVQSGNEELQSTNEELLTAKEELQSTNEELTTVNEEMHGRNAELQQMNNDLLNLLSSVNIPVLMLGNDLRIRRFTPQAEKLFNLLATDVGRPVNDLRLKINLTDLVALCEDVRDQLTSREREVQDVDGRFYSMWVRPYRTSENRIDGVVLSLFDITERKQSAEARYRRLFESAIDGIVIVDANSGEILDVNPYLIRLVGYGRNRFVGTKFWETPLFQDGDINESLLDYLREAESVQKSLSLPTSSGQRVSAEIVCSSYNDGGKRRVQFNVRDISARMGA